MDLEVFMVKLGLDACNGKFNRFANIQRFKDRFRRIGKLVDLVDNMVELIDFRCDLFTELSSEIRIFVTFRQEL